MQIVVPANRIADVLNIPNVVAVQQDKLEQLQSDPGGDAGSVPRPCTSNSPAARRLAGRGVVFGVIDSGVWPEHPSFANRTDLADTAPDGRRSQPRSVQLRRQPAHAGCRRRSSCNNKLIAGDRSFLDTYNSIVGGEVYPTSARDSNGHGTHTGSTSAGNVAHVRGPARHRAGPDRWHRAGGVRRRLQGVRRRGLLPDRHGQGDRDRRSSTASTSSTSRSPAATTRPPTSSSWPSSTPTRQACSSPHRPATPVPAASTSDHLSPWVTTVAASTQGRQFASTLTVKATDGATTTFVGSTITSGLADTPVVFPAAGPGGVPDPLCLVQQPAHTYDGKIVACQRGPNRVLKGFTVHDAGAAGMILYNTTRPQTEMTDNHWLPTVHIDEGDEMLAFATAHGGLASASFTKGQAVNGDGDVMTDFSSRGPGARASSSPTSRLPACRSSPARRRRQRARPRVRPASTSSRSPARPCRRRTSPARPILLAALHPFVDAGSDQVGADDDGLRGRRQGGRRDAGRSVRLRQRARGPPVRRQPGHHVRRRRVPT